MDDRIKKAALKFKVNRRTLRRERGLADQFSTFATDDYLPLGDDAVFADVDATPEEIILLKERQLQRERTQTALLTKWALSGLATEMTMHEANGLLSSLKGNAERLLEEHPKDSSAKWLLHSISRLDDNFSFLSRFKASRMRDHSAGPKTILDGIHEEFGWRIKKGEIVIEPTEAFLKSDIRGDERTFLSVFQNLARNSFQWTYRADTTPCVIRIDARTVEYLGEEWDEDSETSKPAMRKTDIVVFEDNGPGVKAGMGDDVFDPSVSGRGSAGIGLHLCRAVLEADGHTIVLSNERSQLGGAVFFVGKYSVLRPDQARFTTEERPRELELSAALDSMRDLIASGNLAEAANLSDVYEEAAGLALRIRLRGAEGPYDSRLVEAVDEFEQASRSISSEHAPTQSFKT